MNPTAPEMVLDYVRALVWPALVVVALIVFRKQLGQLIERVTEVSAAGASVKFGEKTAKLADRAELLVEPTAARRATAARAFLRLESGAPEEAIVDPTLAFLAAYGELEAAARDAGPTAEVVAPLPVPVFRALAEKGYVPAEAIAVAEELRSIRNEVAHGKRRLESFDAENLAATARSLAAVCLAAVEVAREGKQE